MTIALLFSLSAVMALVPISILSFRRDRPARDRLFWFLLAVAVAGPAAWAWAQIAGQWHTGLSSTLWVVSAATLILFVPLAALSTQGWRLTPLLMPYHVWIGVVATMWMAAPERPMAAGLPEGWVAIHILVSVATYALVTLAAMAALAAFLQERALKTKRPTTLSRLLPSVADSEAMLVRLLALGEVVLGLGLATGIAVEMMASGRIMVVDHKTLLSITTFVVIGGLLLAHWLVGTRGRMATRLVLVAYLLLTLGYPGVKFVTDILMA